jgi:hypothetical protein
MFARPQSSAPRANLKAAKPAGQQPALDAPG